MTLLSNSQDRLDAIRAIVERKNSAPNEFEHFLSEPDNNSSGLFSTEYSSKGAGRPRAHFTKRPRAKVVTAESIEQDRLARIDTEENRYCELLRASLQKMNGWMPSSPLVTSLLMCARFKPVLPRSSKVSTELKHASKMALSDPIGQS